MKGGSVLILDDATGTIVAYRSVEEVQHSIESKHAGATRRYPMGFLTSGEILRLHPTDGFFARVERTGINAHRRMTRELSTRPGPRHLANDPLGYAMELIRQDEPAGDTWWSGWLDDVGYRWPRVASAVWGLVRLVNRCSAARRRRRIP